MQTKAYEGHGPGGRGRELTKQATHDGPHEHGGHNHAAADIGACSDDGEAEVQHQKCHQDPRGKGSGRLGREEAAHCLGMGCGTGSWHRDAFRGDCHSRAMTGAPASPPDQAPTVQGNKIGALWHTVAPLV